MEWAQVGVDFPNRKCSSTFFCTRAVASEEQSNFVTLAFIRLRMVLLDFDLIYSKIICIRFEVLLSLPQTTVIEKEKKSFSYMRHRQHCPVILCQCRFAHREVAS